MIKACVERLEGEQIGSFIIKKAINGQYYFVLKAENGEIVATSETYTTKQSCQHGLESVKRIARNAEVIDLAY